MIFYIRVFWNIYGKMQGYLPWYKRGYSQTSGNGKITKYWARWTLDSTVKMGRVLGEGWGWGESDILQKSNQQFKIFFTIGGYMHVATNVAREFLQLIDKHFPPSHPLHSICNRSTIKVSYRCLPNMGSVIARHNSKVLKNSDAT